MCPNHVLYLIHGVACSDSVNHNRVQVLSILYRYLLSVRIELAASRLSLQKLREPTTITIAQCVREFWGLINLIFVHHYELLLWCMISFLYFFFTWAHKGCGSKFRVGSRVRQYLEVGGYIGRNIVNITIKMKTIARKSWMIKIITLRLRSLF